MLEGMTSRLYLTLALPLVAACGAKLDGPPYKAALGDAGGSDDGAGAIVDAPVDARPCVGGDAHVSDGTSCFVFVKTSAHHEDAVASCTAMNAHLAKVETAAQNTMIATLVTGADSFLGASDVVTEGTFVWEDGTPLSFSKFRTGEPSNGQGQYQEDCLVIEGSKTPNDTWDDRPCDPVPNVGGGNYAFVCQY